MNRACAKGCGGTRGIFTKFLTPPMIARLGPCECCVKSNPCTKAPDFAGGYTNSTRYLRFKATTAVVEGLECCCDASWRHCFTGYPLPHDEGCQAGRHSSGTSGS